jgi:hypothetical protein
MPRLHRVAMTLWAVAGTDLGGVLAVGDVVRRYWEQCTEAKTAALLGCSEGTVKSAASRGLRRLRALSGPWQEPVGFQNGA